MKKIIIEASSIAQDKKTGVGYFSESLAGSLEKSSGISTKIFYLWLNFLDRHTSDSSLLNNAAASNRIVEIRAMSQRLYAKLVYMGIAPPIPIQADWILFPNFYIWPTIGRAKKAVIIHDMCFMRYPEYVEDKNQKFLSKVAVRAIKKSDLIIANSVFTKNEIIQLIDVSEDKIVTIDIPVDATQFSDDKGMSRLKARYGIHKSYILSLGTIEPRKNLSLLVNAYCQLPEVLRNKYSLVLAGKWGWKTESIKALIEEKQANGFDIITTSYIDNEDKGTLYRNASAYAISTYYEGFGMPLLEALHCGIPTVATDIPVLREVAGSDACLWATFDVSDFSEKLKMLLTSPALVMKLKEEALEQSTIFSWDKTAQKLLERMVLSSDGK